MNVVLIGIKLEGLLGVPDAEPVVARLRRDEGDAWAELAAVRIARGPANLGEVELGPIVRVGMRNRRPDFRIRENRKADWTYVEVTAPTASNERNRLRILLERLAGDLNDQPAPYVLEAILRREPTEGEISDLLQILRREARSTSVEIIHLENDLGLVLANHAEPHTVVLEDRGEPPTSRLGLMHAQISSDGRSSSLTLRIAFRDERTARFLDSEAKQLPREAPGVIMVSMDDVVSSAGAWEQIVTRRYQPRLHTRVSATCLFASAVIPGEGGMEAPIANKTIPNPHAQLPLPPWLVENLSGWPMHLISPPRVAEG